MFIKNNVFVIFGATGNLSIKKLFPAFYGIDYKKINEDNFSIIAIGRRPHTNDDFKKIVETSVKTHSPNYNDKTFDEFVKNIHYLQMDFTKPHDYKILDAYIKKQYPKEQYELSMLYYLATSPDFFGTITDSIHNELTFLYRQKSLLIEKPFGHDYKSACQLNKKLSRNFRENEIYRIDHYLGKEMIRNIIFIRFANQMIESVWHKDSIDNIQMTISETVGIEKRGAYFESSGTFRDMVQNHMLQLITLIAMDRPKSLNTEDIQEEKIKVLKHLRQFDKASFESDVTLGQYSRNDMLDYKGYREELNVNDKSLVETFVGMKLFVDTPNFKDVPFYIKTGKRLDKKEAYVTIQLKKPHGNKLYNEHFTPNTIQISIQPIEGVNFKLNVKAAGSDFKSKTISADYCHNCDINYTTIDAYEKIIIDAMNQDHSVFTCWEEVEKSWRFIDQLTNTSEDLHVKKLESYMAGSKGPESFYKLLERDGITWWPI